MDQKHVIVIGAGFGGIAAAARLAQEGLKVTVIEKNDHPGGRCDRLVREGHTFDTGPTLLVMPLVYDAEFTSLGSSFREVLDLQRVDPTYSLVFDDGSRLALSSDMATMHDQLEAIEPGSFDGYLRYVDEGCRHYEQAMTHLVDRDFRHWDDFFNLGNLPLVYTLKPLARHYDHMDAYFASPRLKSAFTFQDVYMGLSPFEAPATFSMMPYTEIAHGVWYPRRGMYSIVEALLEIASQAGVEFIYDCTVKKIELNSKRAKGVILEDGQLMPADAVLANADLPYVYQKLLPPSAEAERLAQLRYSCSVVSFFWGVDQPYPQLGPHTLFLADDYRQNFVEIIDELTLPSNPSLYIHAPTRLDPTMAPPGEETLIAVVPVGHLDEENKQDWETLIEKSRQAVFQRLGLLGIHDLEAHIKFEIRYTPLSWRMRYNLVKGATHGLCHNLTQLGYFRPANRHADYHNLYFVGASTRPGTGLPTALISARQAAQRILDDFADAEQ